MAKVASAKVKMTVILWPKPGDPLAQARGLRLRKRGWFTEREGVWVPESSPMAQTRMSKPLGLALLAKKKNSQITYSGREGRGGKPKHWWGLGPGS